MYLSFLNDKFWISFMFRFTFRFNSKNNGLQESQQKFFVKFPSICRWQVGKLEKCWGQFAKQDQGYWGFCSVSGGGRNRSNQPSLPHFCHTSFCRLLQTVCVFVGLCVCLWQEQKQSTLPHSPPLPSTSFCTLFLCAS